jgi:hypothetical protein
MYRPKNYNFDFLSFGCLKLAVWNLELLNHHYLEF